MGKGWHVVRRLMLVVVLVLVAHYIWHHLGALRHLELSLTPSRLLVAVAGGLGWVLVQSLLWRVVLRAVDASTGVRAAIAQVWLPNLGKYVPGKVWAAVGRVYLSRLCGIPLARATVGLAIENISFILAGAILAATTLPVAAFLVREGASGDLRDADLLLPVFATVIIGLIVVHPRVWGGAAGWILRRLRREPIEPHIGYGRSLILVAFYVGSWVVLGIGMCAWTTAIAPLTLALGLRIVGLYIIAWSLGYLMMLAPAGIGVREGIMMAGLAGQLAPEQAVAIALGLRVYFTLIDLGGALLAVAVAPGLARRLADMNGGAGRA